MWPNDSCNLSDMFTSRKQTPKPAQPNVVGMKTPNGPVSLWRTDPLLYYSLSDSVEHDALAIGNLVHILHSRCQSHNPAE